MNLLQEILDRADKQDLFRIQQELVELLPDDLTVNIKKGGEGFIITTPKFGDKLFVSLPFAKNSGPKWLARNITLDSMKPVLKRLGAKHKPGNRWLLKRQDGREYTIFSINDIDAPLRIIGRHQDTPETKIFGTVDVLSASGLSKAFDKLDQMDISVCAGWSKGLGSVRLDGKPGFEIVESAQPKRVFDKQGLFKLQQDVIDLGHGYDMELLGEDRFAIKRDGLSTADVHRFGSGSLHVIGRGGNAGPNAQKLTAEWLAIRFAEKAFFDEYAKGKVVDGVKISGDEHLYILEKPKAGVFSKRVERKGMISLQPQLGFTLFISGDEGAHTFISLSYLELPDQWAKRMVGQLKQQLK